MSILSGTAEIVDRWLGIDEAWDGSAPRYVHETTFRKLVHSPPACDGRLLVSQLLQRVTTNWLNVMSVAPRRPSITNWRFKKELHLSESNLRQETVLEKRIAAITDARCANQIPTSSGLLDRHGKHRNIDLSERNRDEYELIELKVDANTPVAAAIQAMCYGVIYLLWRLHRDRMIVSQADQPVLTATAIHLRVLAPAEYYQRGCGSLVWLEQAICSGISKVCNDKMGDGLTMDFRFDVFPDGFCLDCTDEQLLGAWKKRGSLHHDRI